MAVMYIMLPASLALAALALVACIRAARRGQFDDLDSPPIRMLVDDEPAREPSQPPPNDWI